MTYHRRFFGSLWATIGEYLTRFGKPFHHDGEHDKKTELLCNCNCIYNHLEGWQSMTFDDLCG